MNIIEFHKKCSLDSLLDLQIDKQFSEECNNREGLVIDYRPGFKFVMNAFHIFDKISEDTAIERLKTANRENEAFHTLRERNNLFKSQFINTCFVIYTDESFCGLVILNNKNKTSEDILGLILNSIHLKNSKRERVFT